MKRFARTDEWEVPADVRAVRVALVGCGTVAQTYYAPALQALAQQGKCKVVALFDPDAVARTMLHQMFPAASSLAHFYELLPRELDLAIVASPPRWHAEQSMKLLEAGIAVLCEKPLATSCADAQRMVDTALQAQRLLVAGMVRRFFPAAQAIHQLLLSKALGAVESFVYAEGEPFRWPVQSPAYFQKSSAGGGVLLDIGAHVLDLLTLWWGEPTAVHYADDALGGIEVNCAVHLAFADGQDGVVRLSRDCTLANELVIRCERGTIRWPLGEVNQVQVRFAGTDFAVDGVLHQTDAHDAAAGNATPMPASFEACFLAQLANVLDAVQGHDAPRVPGASVLPGLRLIEQCYRHRTLMEMGWLSQVEEARARELQGATA